MCCVQCFCDHCLTQRCLSTGGDSHRSLRVNIPRRNELRAELMRTQMGCEGVLDVDSDSERERGGITHTHSVDHHVEVDVNVKSAIL